MCVCLIQPRNAGWTGDPSNQAQWNPAIGKPNQKIVNQNPAQYGGVDDLNWNLPQVRVQICWFLVSSLVVLQLFFD